MDERIFQIEGWIHKPDLLWLNETALRIPENKIIVEIGAWKGLSTSAIMTGAMGKNPVITIDTWMGSPDEPAHDIAKTQDIFAIFKDNINSLGIDIQSFESFDKLENKCYHLKSDSMDAYKLFPDESIDWFFYDGRHTTTGENLDVWMPKVKKDGILTGDDYFCFYEYIQQEIHKRFYIHQIVFNIWVRWMNGEKPEWLP